MLPRGAYLIQAGTFQDQAVLSGVSAFPARSVMVPAKVPLNARSSVMPLAEVIVMVAVWPSLLRDTLVGRVVAPAV